MARNKIAFFVVLGIVLILLTSSLFKATSLEQFSVDELLLEASKGVVFEDSIVVSGKIDVESVKVDAQKSEVRFNLVSVTTNNKIPILIRGDSKPDLTDKEIINVKGLYTVERLFIGKEFIKN